MSKKEEKAKEYSKRVSNRNPMIKNFVECAFMVGWEECIKYLQSLPLDEAANRILYHGTKIGDKSTFND